MASQYEDPSGSNHIAPWRSMGEFYTVYSWLFDEHSDEYTKRRALEMLTVWKIRRLYLTPPPLLGTFEMLSAQLKDNPLRTDHLFVRQVQTNYLTAFARVLKHMAPIVEERRMAPIINIAKEDAIQAFLADLQDLCSNEEVEPEVEYFRIKAQDCMNWIHDIYWVHSAKNFHDVSGPVIRGNVTMEYENRIKWLIKVYDITCEALYRKYEWVDELVGNFEVKRLQLLEEYSKKVKSNNLTLIVDKVADEMIELNKREGDIRLHGEVFSYIFCRCKYFFETGSKFYNLDKDTGRKPQAMLDLIGLHQHLFHSMGRCGIIDIFFKALLVICENNRESDIRRAGASFWISKIMDGFVLLRDVRLVVQKKKKEKPANIMDLSILNTSKMSKQIQKIYKHLGLECNGEFIFGDSVQRPWRVQFENEFIRERIFRATKYTKDVIMKIQILSECELLNNFRSVMEWMSIYIDDYLTEEAKRSRRIGLKRRAESPLPIEIDSIPGMKVKQYGIWREADDDADWASCPIGRLPWE